MTPDAISVTAAAGLAVVAAYVVADLAARFAQRALRAIAGGHQLDEQLVNGTRRVVRLVIFLITAAALILPALR